MNWLELRWAMPVNSAAISPEMKRDNSKNYNLQSIFFIDMEKCSFDTLKISTNYYGN